MDWLFDHFQLLVAIGAAFAYWLNRRRQAAEQEGEPPAEPPPVPRHATQESAEDPVRRIQEEIRRKIRERQAGLPQGPAEFPHSEPPPVPEQPLTSFREPVPPAPPRHGRPDLQTATLMAEAQQNREWTEELHRAEERRREAEKLAEKAAEELERRTQEELAAVPERVTDLLGDSASLRKAVLLKEILGPPVGLR